MTQTMQIMKHHRRLRGVNNGKEIVDWPDVDEFIDYETSRCGSSIERLNGWSRIRETKWVSSILDYGGEYDDFEA